MSKESSWPDEKRCKNIHSMTGLRCTRIKGHTGLCMTSKKIKGIKPKHKGTITIEWKGRVRKR